MDWQPVTLVPGAAVSHARHSGAVRDRNGLRVADPAELRPGRPARRGRLPVPLSSFVGRDEAKQAVLSRLRASRLVTLTGAGGVGKTRLAVEVAAKLGAEGVAVVFVDLAEVAPGDSVLPAVAASVGADSDAHQTGFDAVVATVDDDRAVVVVDNCEHVRASCAAAVRAVLEACAQVQVLATSRQRLGIAGEVTWPVPSLSLTDDTGVANAFECEAVRLFCERAAAVRPGFVPTADDVGAIVEICRRVDGNPLAIELATARVVALSPVDIAVRLDEPLRFLVASQGAITVRHRSLEAVQEWSWALLSPAEKALLARLSVFHAVFTADAVAAVCPGGEVAAEDVVEVLSALVDKSVLVADIGPGGASYRLASTLRPFAAAKLAAAGEVEAVADRHACWCAETVAETGVVRAEAGRGERWAVGCADLAVALEWAASSGRAELAVRLGMKLVRGCRAAGDQAAARQWLERVVAASSDAPATLRARVLIDDAWEALKTGQLAAAHTQLEHAVALARQAGDPGSLAQGLAITGFASVIEGDTVAGLTLLADGLALARSTGDPGCLAEVLAAAANARLLVGDIDAAQAASSECRTVAGDAAPREILAGAALACGRVALVRGDYQAAEDELACALKLGREVGDAHAAALALAWLGELACRGGDAATAHEAFADSLREAGEALPWPRAEALVGLGRLACADPGRARGCFAEALQLARAGGPAHMVSRCLRGLALAAQAAGDHETVQPLLEEALAAARGCRDPLGEADAREELARIVARRGEDRRAATLHRQALTLRRRVGDPAAAAGSLEGLAAVVAAGDAAAAARLMGAAEGLRQRHGCPRPAHHRFEHEAAVAAVRQRLGLESFDAAWAAGSRLSTEEVVTAATSRGKRRSRPSTGWAALTPAEREVATLAAHGHSNQAIADEMVVSRRTVETHLQHAYAKLGIRSRGELTHYVSKW